MAELRIKGPFVGPGEQKTAERLRDELPADWDIFASRKLPGETRDDVDLIVVGQGAIFVLEEKAWGPRIVCDDNYWYVNDTARPNPLNRNAQLARKVAGLLREHAAGYRNVKGKRVIPAVILSHDAAQVFAGRNHHADENIWPLATAAEKLQEVDAAHPALGPARKAIVTYLDDRPAASGRLEIGDYSVKGRIEVPGLEQAYFARSADDQHVILKCYRVQQLRELGEPRAFLERETRALNKLAAAGRTWRSLPYFEDHAHQFFVVPVIPPDNARTLEAAVKKPGPERDGGALDADVARAVTADAFAALAEVHEHGLVHRALHPRRVWLGRRMRVLFSDFHLAKMRGDVTISPWATDYDISEDYRAPECHQQVGLATERSDVYSLAKCLAYWLLGGSIAGQSDDQIGAALREGFPWGEQLASALAASPGDRPEAEALAAALVGPADVVAANAAEVDSFEPGSLVGGRYEIKGQLGRGGFATSWQVYDRQRACTMVLKEFHHGVPDELRAEYRAGDILRHDRCGAVYDLHLDSEPHYLVSEYVEGQSLAVPGVERDIEELRAIAADILEALSYIHSKDLVHGDVTPPNIIVANDGSGRAKLIDFGLAIPTGQRPGGWNPRFAAPEVVHGDTASSLSDLFGFAASLVYAMLGRAPFAMLQGSFQAQPPTDDEKNIWGIEGAALLDVLCKAIDATPSLRPATAEAFLALINSTRPAASKRPEHADREWDSDVALVRQINPTVEATRRLYRASGGGNAGNRGLDDPFAVRTYVTTLLDERLLPQVINGDLDLVLLSGNPGDGKTSLLVQLGEELARRGASVVASDAAGWRIRFNGRLFIAVFDASEAHGNLDSDAMLHQALEPVARQAEPATALIAINDGRLLQFFTDYEDQYEDWKFAIDDQLNGLETPGSRVALVDLKRRSLASGPGDSGLAGRALARLTDPEFWSICETCEARLECPILANRDLLAGPGAMAFNELITISHLRRRRRATFRDVRSAAAWLITGDRGCEDVHELREAGRNPRLVPGALAHDLAFATSSNDYLVDEWANLDPAEVAAPALDRFRRSQAGERTALQYASNRSIARAIYFRELSADIVRPEDLSAYRYLGEFQDMLAGNAGAESGVADRLLLGVSRLVGAHGYTSPGLAVSSGMAHSAWAILHVMPREEFELVVPTGAQSYIETMADTLTLRHRSGPFLELTLDTAEIVLRAADGELVNDFASDAIRQEIDSFVQKLARQPSMAARIVDSAGTEAVASVQDRIIVLEQS